MSSKSIELTDEQYRSLLKLVYIGDWIATSNEIDPSEESELHKVSQLVMSHAKTFGAEELVDSEDESMLFPTSKLDEDPMVRDLIEDHEEYTFWDELSWRLADEAAEECYSAEDLEGLDAMTRCALIHNMQVQFAEEFADNGLDNVGVDVEIAVPDVKGLENLSFDTAETTEEASVEAPAEPALT